jgi:hypothetical protein
LQDDQVEPLQVREQELALEPGVRLREQGLELVQVLALEIEKLNRL